MPASTVFNEYVVANSISFGGRAAFVESYGPMLDDPPPVGDMNVHIPGRAGREPYGADPDQLHITFTVFIDGDFNFENDDISANAEQQLIENRLALREALGVELLAVGDGTVPFEWHQPDGETVFTGDVQSLGFTSSTYLSPSIVRVSWDLLVPSSFFEGPGS